MKIPILCFECMSQGDEPRWYFSDLTDDGIYRLVCDAKHDVTMLLANPKHEVLFESGAAALIAGFHREAMTSFHVALERYFEFVTATILRHLGIARDAVEQTKANVSKQSERQLGGFLFLYLVAFGREWTTARNLSGMAKVRNDVIHGGRIPSRSEALDYGQKVLDIVRALNVELESLNREVMITMTQVELLVRSRDVLTKSGPLGVRVYGSGQRFLLSHECSGRAPTERLEDALARMERGGRREDLLPIGDNEWKHPS